MRGGPHPLGDGPWGRPAQGEGLRSVSSLSPILPLPPLSARDLKGFAVSGIYGKMGGSSLLHRLLLSSRPVNAGVPQGSVLSLLFSFHDVQSQGFACRQPKVTSPALIPHPYPGFSLHLSIQQVSSNLLNSLTHPAHYSPGFFAFAIPFAGTLSPALRWQVFHWN